MKQINKFTAGLALAITLSATPTMQTLVDTTNTIVEAHSGRTDSNGGHHDYKNVSGLGSYHYHCGGYPAHLHKNGVCPYKKTSSTTTTTSNKSTVSKSTIKAVQKALNKRGYNCGTADGIMGSKTTAALKKFQKNKKLTVDGKIGPQVKKALGIS